MTKTSNVLTIFKPNNEKKNSPFLSLSDDLVNLCPCDTAFTQAFKNGLHAVS